jgi:hypothetical protein
MRKKRLAYKFFDFFENNSFALMGLFFGLFVFLILGWITYETAHPSFLPIGEKTLNEMVLDNIGMIFHNFLTSWIFCIILVVIAIIIGEIYLNIMKIDLSDYKDNGMLIKLGYVAYRKFCAIFATILYLVALSGWLMMFSFCGGLIWIILSCTFKYWIYILISAALIFIWLYINYQIAGEE